MRTADQYLIENDFIYTEDYSPTYQKAKMAIIQAQKEAIEESAHIVRENGILGNTNFLSIIQSIENQIKELK